MHWSATYEVARQRIADQQRAARQAGEARERRAAARGRHARKEAPETVVTPVIPDYADEMFGNETGDRPARSSR